MPYGTFVLLTAIYMENIVAPIRMQLLWRISFSMSSAFLRISPLVFFVLAANCFGELPEGSPTHSWQRVFVTGLYTQVQSKVAAGSVTECRGMAEILDGIADVAESPAQFSALLGTFIGPNEAARRANPYLLSGLTTDWNPARQGAFNSFQKGSGFAAEYIQPGRPIQDHASRFAAFFQLGFSSGGLPPEAFRVSSLDDPEIPNMKMEITGVVAGAQLRNGVLRMGDVAIHVRRNVCSQEPQPADFAEKSVRPSPPPSNRVLATLPGSKGRQSLKGR